MPADQPYQHRARKRFGQNFLHDEHVIARIVRAITPGPGQRLIEIGPGQGALTAPLLDAAGRLTCIEIDRDLAQLLRERYAGNPGFNLIEGDVLDVDFATLTNGPASLRIVGNLPYNISTPLLFHLLRHHPLIHDMVFMLQLEVVQRLAAAPGTDDYGRLSVMMQYYCEVEMLFKVPPGAFVPQPKVDSAIVRLTPHRPSPFTAVDTDALARVVKAAFGQRRKTLRNTLKAVFSPEKLAVLPIDTGLRAENLSVTDYVRLAALIDTGDAPHVADSHD
ncbi:MAG TPA: 16S rRNA (adenine(1518)-N(6)/adenine(1519)-N(6))-dimethyltransferase RsmA [Candidatus Acidoferrum sp.]|nr:16S rRNA (adenine(1518)-N(6)/adenine(1519)-N(6))-dimethyltransferase RsmA [Candidatus Acidoferrum sp.]